jgi:CRISPR/Cas system-associated exonuclease Cas4 (RecB family)
MDFVLIIAVLIAVAFAYSYIDKKYNQSKTSRSSDLTTTRNQELPKTPLTRRESGSRLEQTGNPHDVSNPVIPPSQIKAQNTETSTDGNSGPDHVSFSQIETFGNCPKQYWYRQRSGIPEKFINVEAFAGRVAHGTIEWLYQSRLDGESPNKTEVKKKFEDIWHRDHSETEVRIPRIGIDEAHYQGEVGEAVMRFHSGPFKADRSETVALEEKVTMDLGPIQYIGYVDRVADENGTRKIIDYKTSRSTRAVEGDWLQVKAYGAALMQSHDLDKIGLRYEFLVMQKNFESEMSQGDTKAVVHSLTNGWKKIDQTAEFRAKPTPLCHWCGYSDQCEDFKRSVFPKRRPRFRG